MLNILIWIKKEIFTIKIAIAVEKFAKNVKKVIIWMKITDAKKCQVIVILLTYMVNANLVSKATI